MKASQLINLIAFAVANRLPILIKGKPGIGKSDVVTQGVELAQAELEIFHPVVSDPTDFKGMPFADKNGAEFLPFGNLKRLIDAKKPLVAFIDDIGQAPAAVQASLMQLILAREINGKKISDFVTFIAATNRKEDKAAVSGILEPVKSRFYSIVELEINTDDWVRWALSKGNMPIELISFIRYRPALLDDFQPTKDIVNSPSPRTVAAIGKMQNAGIPNGLEFELFKGAAGEAFATEYKAFLDIYRDLPNIDQILLAPDTVEVPESPAVLYAVGGVLATKINDVNSVNAFSYIKRLPAENGAACVKDAMTKNPNIAYTKGFIDWSVSNGNIIFSDDKKEEVA